MTKPYFDYVESDQTVSQFAYDVQQHYAQEKAMTAEAEEDKNNPKVVIDVTDGVIQSIISDHSLDVIEVDYGVENYQNTVKGSNNPEDMQLIPLDINNPNAPENGGIFTVYNCDVDADYVAEVDEYVSDPHHRSAFTHLALDYFRKMEEEGIEDDEDE